MESKLKQIQQDYLEKISQADNLKQLDEIFLELFGKNGVVNKLSEEFPKLPKDQFPIIGPLFNSAKQNLEKTIRNKREEIREAGYAKLSEEKIDLNLAGLDLARLEEKGHLHPTTQFIKETVNVFKKLGFQQYDAPEIDSDYYIFEVLNIPQDHPARDLWDTLYLDAPEKGVQTGKMLLRTHTSNAQIRIMKEIKPPIRMMSIGRCYRYENVDARHEHTFMQFELVYVDKGLSMTNLQYLSEYYIKETVGENIKVRLRPKYYPFVEPGFGIDAQCIFCKGKGCKICGGIGWLEIGGAGMIHPQVLKNGGYDPDLYSGIAWGPGVERMMMIKHGVEDIRSFLSGDLKFLEKF